jgi:hypothetical protein
MLFFPIRKLKIYLISLCCLIVILISSITYTDEKEIKNASEEQYRMIFQSLDASEKIESANSVHVQYLSTLPEASIIFIYLGYLIIAIAIINSAKINLDESTNKKG